MRKSIKWRLISFSLNFGCFTVATATQLRRPNLINVYQFTPPILLYFFHSSPTMMSYNAVSWVAPVTKANNHLFGISLCSLHHDYLEYFVEGFLLKDVGLEFPLSEGVDDIAVGPCLVHSMHGIRNFVAH